MRASLVLLPGLRLHPKRKQQVGSQRIGNDPKLSTFPSDTASCWEHHQFRHPASTANAEACQVQHTAVKVVLQAWRVQVQVRKHEVAIATSHDARPSGTLPPCILQCREVRSQPRKGITSKDLSILPERHDSSARPSRLQAEPDKQPHQETQKSFTIAQSETSMLHGKIALRGPRAP